MMVLNRGDIVLVNFINFNPTKGGEIGKLRPAIVMSETIDNEILDTVIVIPLSTHNRKRCFFQFCLSFVLKIEKSELYTLQLAKFFSSKIIKEFKKTGIDVKLQKNIYISCSPNIEP